MRRKLIIHIGANKTGSSAIQRFLGLNHAALRTQGFVVPDDDCGMNRRVTGWQTFYFQSLFSDVQGPDKLREALDTLEKQAPEAHSFLLSAESLAANRAAPELFKGLTEHYDIRLLLYVRRQDEYLLSSWMQWYSKVYTDLYAWLLENLGSSGNWRNYLEAWERIVPRERITVRVYERQKLADHDIVHDYLAYLGLGPSALYSYPEELVNPSFSEGVVDLVAGNKLIFENAHDNRFFTFVQHITGDRFVRNSRSSAITLSQRKAIIKAYEPCNTWVRNTYFSDNPEPLFTPLRDGDYVYLSQDVLEKQKMDFLVSMLYGIYKERKS